MVDSNKEHGEGRSDIVVYDPVNSRVAVFEAKYAKTMEKMEAECERALNQIMTGCIQKNMRKTMTTSSAMESHFSENGAW